MVKGEVEEKRYGFARPLLSSFRRVTQHDIDYFVNIKQHLQNERVKKLRKLNCSKAMSILHQFYQVCSQLPRKLKTVRDRVKHAGNNLKNSTVKILTENNSKVRETLSPSPV